MNEEIFDVVDDQDRVIGQRTRRQIHAEQLRHRAVHVLVFNQRGDLFLQKRSQQKDCFPGCWDSSAAGHLDQGETYDACAIRELREELGLELPVPLTRLFKIDACPETGHEFVWVYRCIAEGPFTLHPEEIETGAWFSREQITQWLAARPHEFAASVPLIWNGLAARGDGCGAPNS